MNVDTGYPFLNFLLEDKTRYKHARDLGYDDPDDLFLIGDSGGFLMNIVPGSKFVNVSQFYEMADYYRNNSGYTSFSVDSIPHRQIRRREQYRRKHGFSAPCLMMPDGTIKEIRITGEHYNFLNYTRIEQLDTSTIIRGKTHTAKKHYDFPLFLDSQFWTFHCIEFAKRNGFHFLVDKTRRGGFSYIMASRAANTVNNNSRKIVINVAADKKYLTQQGGLTDFAINNLKFYEENTPFVRGIYSQVKEDFRLGYKLPSGVEATNSWHSALLSVSAANNPNCAIGKDAVEVNVEEVSTMENFDEFMTVTEPAMRTGAYVTGFMCGWGTATSGNMQVFEINFYNPKRYNFMPFENVWDKDARDEVCGFFKPYCWGLQGEIAGSYGVDTNGNSNITVSLEIAKRERIQKRESSENYSDYINYLGQYALFPAESFSSATENIFSSEELSAWEERLRVDDDLKIYTDGWFDESKTGDVKFESNKMRMLQGKVCYDWINGVPRHSNEDPHGCVRIWFYPEYQTKHTERGVEKYVPEGLYSITYDPVGINKDKNEITLKHSHNSIQVWMNPNATNNFQQKLVAAYYGRTEQLEEADWVCYCFAKYYNCIGTTGVEVNRGETVSNFKKWNALKYLSFEPLFVWDASLKEQVSKTYGYVISDAGNAGKKLNALRLTREFLYTKIGDDEHGNPVRNFHRIYDYQLILELKKYNPKGNFDRISSLLLRGIEWKAIELKAEHAMSDRVQLTGENLGDDSILTRAWF